ncbi:MAG: O-antigen ligase family protein [Candidatus Acidiferrales bacterium]
MAKVAQIGLVAALFVAVVAFGGTQELVFSLVEVFLLSLCLVFFLIRSGSEAQPLPWLPLGLLGLVVLQVLPLPVSLVGFFRSSPPGAAAANFTTLSQDAYLTLSHLLFLGACLAAFYLTVRVCQRPGVLRGLVLALLGLAALEAFYGLVQYLGGWERILLFPKRFSLGSATGTYINRNHFAGLLVMLIPFAVALTYYQFKKVHSALLAQEDAEGVGLSRGDPSRLAFWFFALILLFTALIFSGSRMGIVAAVVTLLALLALIRTTAEQGRDWLALSVGFFLVAALLALWIGLEPVIFRFEQVGQELGETSETRLAIWRDTLHLIGRYPLLGSGFGTFPVAYTAFQTAFPSKFVNHAHNDYLELASDLGLPGAIFFFALVIALLRRAVLRFQEGGEGFVPVAALGCAGSILALLLVSLTDFNLYIPANALVFSVILGLTYSASGDSGP